MRLQIATIIVLGCCGLAAAAPTEEAGKSSAAFDAPAAEAERARLAAQLKSAVEQFDAMVGASTAAEQAEWREYLDWNSWGAPLLASQPWETAAMQRVVKRLYTAEDGFERPKIVALRTAMTEYLNYDEAVAEAGGDLAGECQRRLATIQSASPAGASYADLEAAAWWLRVMRQAPEKVAALQQEMNGPAIAGLIHRDLIEPKLHAFEKDSEEDRATRRRIQGAVVVGKSSVSSHTKAELAGTADDARIRITTTGQVSSPNNISYSEGVRVISAGSTKFTGVADIYWEGARFAMTSPHVTADTHSQIKEIQAPPLKRGMATRRVREGKGAAEDEVQSLVEREAAESMTAQMQRGVDKINAKSQGLLKLLARTGNSPARWQTRLLDHFVELGYVPATRSGVSSPRREPPPLKGDERIGLSFHDSGVESILTAQVAGAVWTDVQFATLQRELTGGNNPELLIGLEPGRLSAQWSWRLPVRVHFTEEGATVRYRFSTLAIEGESYEAPIEVRADLHVVATPLGLEMQTRGPVTVTTLRDHRLPPHFQLFFERKFAALFGEKFYLDGFQFPAGGHLDPLSGYRVVAAELEPEWIHLRYSNRTANPELVVLEKE